MYKEGRVPLGRALFLCPFCLETNGEVGKEPASCVLILCLGGCLSFVGFLVQNLQEMGHMT